MPAIKILLNFSLSISIVIDANLTSGGQPQYYVINREFTATAKKFGQRAVLWDSLDDI
jgi:hypothetical protein